MRARVYHGPGRKAWEEVPGERVLVSCISACGTCRFCREGRYGQCLCGGGWILGRTIDGTQAEYVSVPFADTSTFRRPDGGTDEEMLMLADIRPTGYEVGVLAGGVRPGDVVAVVGAGPIGLSAMAGARLFSPSHIVAIDLSDARLDAAKQLAAALREHRVSAFPITAGDLMTGPAVTIEAQATVEDAARIMYKRKVKRLPVVDAQGHLTGIVSRADVLSVFDRSDDDIRKEITQSVILDEFMVDPDTIAVTVSDGVVTLLGIPETNELGHEIIGRVRHVQGVVAVRDRLSYPPPERSVPLRAQARFARD